MAHVFFSIRALGNDADSGVRELFPIFSSKNFNFSLILMMPSIHLSYLSYLSINGLKHMEFFFFFGAGNCFMIECLVQLKFDSKFRSICGKQLSKLPCVSV